MPLSLSLQTVKMIGAQRSKNTVARSSKRRDGFFSNSKGNQCSDLCSLPPILGRVIVRTPNKFKTGLARFCIYLCIMNQWEVKDDFRETFLSSHYVDLRDQTPDVRLGGKCLTPLSHLRKSKVHAVFSHCMCDKQLQQQQKTDLSLSSLCR